MMKRKVYDRNITISIKEKVDTFRPFKASSEHVDVNEVKISFPEDWMY